MFTLINRYLCNDCDKINEILEAGRGTFSVSFDDCHHLVSRMVDQRIGPITLLVDVRRVDASNGKPVIRLVDDTKIRADQVDVKVSPQRCSDVCVDKNAEAF